MAGVKGEGVTRKILLRFHRPPLRYPCLFQKTFIASPFSVSSMATGAAQDILDTDAYTITVNPVSREGSPVRLIRLLRTRSMLVVVNTMSAMM